MTHNRRRHDEEPPYYEGALALIVVLVVSILGIALGVGIMTLLIYMAE